jgi:hypothetical protein
VGIRAQFGRTEYRDMGLPQEQLEMVKQKYENVPVL